MSRRRRRDSVTDDILIPQAIGDNTRFVDVKREFNSASTLEHILLVMIPEDMDDLCCYLETLYIILSRIIGTGFINEGINMSDPSVSSRIERSLATTETKLIELMLLKSKDLRYYTLKISLGKWCSSTTVFACICSIRILLMSIRDMKRKQINKEFLIKNSLLLFRKELSEYTQIELWNQCFLLSEKWKNITYSQEIKDLTLALLDEISIMISERSSRKKIDWEDESMSINCGDGTFCVSRLYVDDMSCLFEDFFLTLKIKEMTSLAYRQTDLPSDNVAILSQYLVEWLENEMDNVSDEKFKGVMSKFCTFRCICPGEMNMYTRDSGIETESPFLILQNTRTSLEVNWWEKNAVNEKGGVKLEHPFRCMKNIMTFYLFSKFVNSILTFDFVDHVIIPENQYLAKARDILVSDDPVILQHMGGFMLLHGQSLYLFEEASHALFFWIHLISLNKDCAFRNNRESWELDDIVSIVKGMLKKREIIDAKKEKKMPEVVKDSVFFYHGDE